MAVEYFYLLGCKGCGDSDNWLSKYFFTNYLLYFIIYLLFKNKYNYVLIDSLFDLFSLRMVYFDPISCSLTNYLTFFWHLQSDAGNKHSDININLKYT